MSGYWDDATLLPRDPIEMDLERSGQTPSVDWRAMLDARFLCGS